MPRGIAVGGAGAGGQEDWPDGRRRGRGGAEGVGSGCLRVHRSGSSRVSSLLLRSGMHAVIR
eukprot:2542991-Prymnesium_polylepis.1